MQQRLSIITLGVEDLQKSCAFYEALGFKSANDVSEGIVAFNMQSMTLSLYQREKLAEDAEVPMQNNKEAHPPFTIAHNVSSELEVDELLKHAEAIGAKIIKPAQKVFWGGYSGYFADPDGFLWEVAFNPFSPLGKNGEFQWGGDS